jgi:uncharacterized protein with FMN-binding domain
MRRAVPAVVATTAGLVALLGYKSGNAPAKQVALSSGTSAATSTTTSASGAPAASAASPSATSAPAPAARTVTGPVEYTRYGPVQVQVTVRGSRLVDVEAVQLPNDRPRSVNISNQAAPILRSEALRAGSANIDIVGGATYTSQGYAQSLQAALDAVRPS